MSLASLDGTVLPASEAVIPASDEGFLRGDGVFEVLRLYGGRPDAHDAHLDRMATSAANLRLPFDGAAVRGDVAALLAAAEPGDAVLRLVVTRGGHRLAVIEPLPDMAPVIRLGFVTYAPTRILDGVKSLSYAGNMLATRLARERGFDEALLRTPHGRILEAPTSSFFWVAGGQVRTPPLDDHILASITRARVIELTGAAEAPCTDADLDEADEAFLASTLREVQPVVAVEDRTYPAGEVAAAARAKLRARIDAELHA